ncbi:MAG: ATP-dependent Clp protease ATP-binding subunit, partial [Bacteroidetes bacterium]|nr:ATP-dependent Clp protease ATP-binding subunit [Candidatus Merdivivens pullicola]
PEFLNRIDEQILFNPLTKQDIIKIINLELAKLKKRAKDNGYVIEISDGAKEFIAEKGYDPKYGARPLKRAIQSFVENPVADEIIHRAAIPEYNKIRNRITVRLTRGTTANKTLEIV